MIDKANKYLHKISTWSDYWEIPFNTNKLNILQVETRNKKYLYKMSEVKLESEQCVIDLGVTIVLSVKFSQHCKDCHW